MEDLDLLDTIRLEAEKEKHLGCYRGMIRRARPYRLDADAVQVITELSSGPTIADKLAIYRRLARLPFDTVWIEFDYMDRWRSRLAIGMELPDVPEDVPGRMGWLMERMSDTSWRATTFIQYRPDQTKSGRSTDCFAVTYVVSTEGAVDFRSHVRDASIREAVMATNRPGEMREDESGPYNAPQLSDTVWGFGTVDSQGRKRIRTPLHLWKSTALDLAPSWETIVEARAFSHQAKFDSTISHMIDSARETQGDLRFIITALALLNNVPTVEKTVQRRGMVRVGGGLKPYMVNRIVSIDVPKRRGRVKSILGMLRLAEIRMRRHQVCGHWKRVRGTGEIKWVKDYWRGDAGLGYVDQVREVTSSAA